MENIKIKIKIEMMKCFQKLSKTPPTPDKIRKNIHSN